MGETHEHTATKNSFKVSDLSDINLYRSALAGTCVMSFGYAALFTGTLAVPAASAIGALGTVAALISFGTLTGSSD